MGRTIIVDPEEAKRLQEEIDMPKPKKYIEMLWQPVVGKLMEKYGGVIAEIKEVSRWGDGSGDAFFGIVVRDRERMVEIDKFLSKEEYRLLMDYGVSIRTHITPLKRGLILLNLIDLTRSWIRIDFWSGGPTVEGWGRLLLQLCGWGLP